MTRRKRLVYVAGPFSGPTRQDIEQNIEDAVDLGREVAKLGAKPIIPHANAGDPAFEMIQPYWFWLDGTRELMRRCDATIFTERWMQSYGACRECIDCMKWGHPRFFDLASLGFWLQTARHEIVVTRVDADAFWGAW